MDPSGSNNLPTCDPKIPDPLLTEHADWSWSLAWDYVPGSKTWRLERGDGRARYLKVGFRASVPRISDECVRMRWARLHLPAPEIIDCGTKGEIDWMLTAALPGMDATAADLRLDPAGLVASLGTRIAPVSHQAPDRRVPVRFAPIETAIKRSSDGGSSLGWSHRKRTFTRNIAVSLPNPLFRNLSACNRHPRI